MVPMITPFKDDYQIDMESVERIIENFIAGDSKTLLFGTTGETASITQRQKNEYVKEVMKKFEGRTQIYAAVSDNSFEDAVTAAKTYIDAGVEAVVVLLPGYYPITADQMLNYYEKFAENINGPMFLYNIPATTHLSITLDVIDKLSYHERIIGLKDSERDYERLTSSIDLWKDRDDFSHFIGWGAQCFNGMWLGSDGIVPSTGNFTTSVYKDMYQAVLKGNKEKGELAQEISMEISAVYQKNKILSESLPALKVMMSEAGLCGTDVLLPFTKLPEDEESKIRNITSELIDKYKLKWI
ncbi:MAG: dihydrodipicolinate synthase family protein [Melioribacteraceae bacterium]|nr:dihydrodipicolinate synthase family protein [Melioribacteraceae bacterium]